MRILITGITGFIGQNLLPQMERERHDLLLVVQSSENTAIYKKQGWKVIVGDLNELSGIQPEIRRFHPEVCIHLAWQGIPHFSPIVCQLNLNYAVSFIDFLINETSCQKIIMTGSCFEYGDVKGSCKETDPIHINSYFAWAKNSVYEYARLLCEKSFRNLLWARLFFVYGPGQRQESLIPSLVNSFQQGVVPDIKTPFNANDFVYVEDVAEGLLKMVHASADSGIYNLGSGVATRVIDICKLVEQEMRGNTILTDQLEAKSIQEERVNFWADLNKSKKILNWEPRFSIAQGIHEYINSLEET